MIEETGAVSPYDDDAAEPLAVKTTLAQHESHAPEEATETLAVATRRIVKLSEETINRIAAGEVRYRGQDRTDSNH
jgi:hypothetical protein